ncbi:MAG: cytochrome c-type biogenesis CcmF C-terminal domain-containing protein [Pseudomonadota bacterium]|nr:cytochrome c-type biogenesis CcmF C-terminal domain-containing protein [Pseudomonadota bacterium]
MTGEIGQAFVLGGLACAAAGSVAGFGAGAMRSATGWLWARRLAYGFAACMLLANLTMEYALLTHDFSVRYVAQVGSIDSPTYITIVSLWSSLEGSILFWGLILGAYVAAATAANRDENPSTMPWAIGVWLAVGAFFCFLLAGPANAFLPAPNPVPLDGPGPNPLLQNHVLMIIHPPMLYLGYVGMTIPFGIAAGALFAGRLEASQIVPLRRWLLVAWGFLTVGITLGGWWAYEVLGWGGYWAWDPVENASLLPWLTATAALHAAMLPHRRGALKGWTVTLVLASFLLTLLGTFMTRSGVFNSVHSFSQSDIGPTILAFLSVCLVFSVVLLALRVDKLEGEGAVTAVVSRESAFLLNNLLFVALTFTVLVGTTFPLLAEAVKGVKLSVGEPYFNRMAVPIGVAILFLMGVGPALPWGQASGERVRKQVLPPLGLGIAAMVVGFGVGLREPWPLLTLGCGGFAGYVTLREMIGPVRALVAGNPGTSALGAWAAAVPQALTQSNRRIGGYIVHLGIIAMIVSIAMSSAYGVDAEARLTKGECMAFEGYDICFEQARTVKESNRTLEVADFRATRDGESSLISPALASYPGMMAPIGSPDVKSTLGYDLYLSLMSINGDVAGVHMFRKPIVAWIWLGAGLAALGTLMSLVPSRKAQAAAVAAPVAAEAASK